MSSDRRFAIEARSLGKRFRIFRRPIDRLWQLVLGGRIGNRYFEEFEALSGVDLALRPGQALGIVGVNGAGKSTLLQLIAGTLVPTDGWVRTSGRVAALLELGAGFNPEFTGRENVYLNAATLGLSRREVERRFDEIVDFAGIGAQIDRPVKTYSSGMVVRLAFSVATSIDPDVLIVDEALSVGDGAFARKSFDRIMKIKENGATVLFCSHVLFHVEAFCDQALWLHQGHVRESGPVATVIGRYQEFLDDLSNVADHARWTQTGGLAEPPIGSGNARIESVRVSLDGSEGDELHGDSRRSVLRMEIDFVADRALPAPTAALVLSSEGGRILATHASIDSGVLLRRGDDGRGTAVVTIPGLPFNKGRYRVGAYLMCERGIHVYQWIDPVAHVNLHCSSRWPGYFLVEANWAG